MTEVDDLAPWIGMGVGLAATVVWTFVLWRTARAYVGHVEHRLTWLTMAVGAWLASVGTLASAVGFAVQRGVLPELIPNDTWSFVASVGRGALLAAGLVVLAHYRPPRRWQ